MKRDMELIRLSLLEVEGEEPKPDLAAFTEEQKVYHMALCIGAGLVDGEVVKDGGGSLQRFHAYAKARARRVRLPGAGQMKQMKNEEWWLVASVARTSRAGWVFIIGRAFF